MENPVERALYAKLSDEEKKTIDSVRRIAREAREAGKEAPILSDRMSEYLSTFALVMLMTADKRAPELIPAIQYALDVGFVAGMEAARIRAEVALNEKVPASS